MLHATAFAAFDLVILTRHGAREDWGPARIEAAKAADAAMDGTAREPLTRTIIAGLPGAEESDTLARFREALARDDGIGAAATPRSRCSPTMATRSATRWGAR